MSDDEIAAKIATARAEGFARGHAEGVRHGYEEARRAAFSSALGELRGVVARLEQMAYGIEADVVQLRPEGERR
jgi:flagellar biosynthesis/type III secretory pathway protein FliH